MTVALCGNLPVCQSLLWVLLTTFGKFLAASVCYLYQTYERSECYKPGFCQTFFEATDLLTLWGQLLEDGAGKGQEISLLTSLSSRVVAVPFLK